MQGNVQFKRVLLKLSGEVLKGSRDSGIEPNAVLAAAERIKEVVNCGVELALVIGAGNIFRGLAASRNGMNRTCADYMGMLATVINALAMRDALEAVGLDARIQTAIPITGIADPFDQHKAMKHLNSGSVLIFAGGTGHPYFTTDTTAALRACEIGAQAIFKATKVDGVYSADPKVYPDAVRYPHISFADALAQRLQVMDSTAFSLCMDNDIPIVVFDFSERDTLRKIIDGDLSSATIVDSDKAV